MEEATTDTFAAFEAGKEAGRREMALELAEWHESLASITGASDLERGKRTAHFISAAECRKRAEGE